MRLFGAEERMERIKKITPDDTPIEANILSGVIESSQKRLESVNFERRKNVLMYDDVNNQQRKIIYSQRREILEDGNMRDKIIDMMEQVAENAAYSCAPSEEHEEWDFAPLKAKFRGILCTDDDFNYTDDELKKLKVEELSEELYRRAVARYEYQEGLFGEQMREIERVVLLRCIDELWMDHIDYMQDLKGGIGLNAYAQRNPVNEYKLIGADAFDSMIADIRENTVRAVLSAVPRTEIKREQMAKEQSASIENIGGDKPAKKKPMVKKAAEKVGRNDPCPCGSGKKCKKCCGAADGSDD
jgi:preprotein translocase subunit SecA